MRVSVPVTAIIGASGGSLSSADGTLSLEVPAGAFAADETVSIQEITNEAPGAKGRAFRIKPEGLHTPVPMTLRFKYTEETLRGTKLDLLRVAYQDTTRLWHAYVHPTIDTVNHTLAVHTTHFSDWSLVVGAQIMPAQATVKVGQSLELRVLDCQRGEPDPNVEGSELVVGVPECEPSPLDAYETSGWSVNATQKMPNRVYSGNHGGSLKSTLARSALNWESLPAVLLGHFAMDDSDVYSGPNGGFTARFVGSEEINGDNEIKRFITLKLHPETCTFDLRVQFATSGTSCMDGKPQVEGVLNGGNLVLLGLPIGSDMQGNLHVMQGTREVPAGKDFAQTNYIPPNAQSFETQEGKTIARWTIKALF